MRLLHTTRLELQEFFDDKIPEYAIISHRWEGDEITLQDFVKLRQLENPEFQPFADFLRISMTASASSPGYLKILKCCEYVASRTYQWVWIDTCCIDKTSSAELSEAINSMYRWYERAYICFVYLSDVALKRDAEDVELEESELSEDDRGQFCWSRWFTRGWTLQELLAPEQLIFLDHDWKTISSKYKFRKLLSSITRIPAEALARPSSGHSIRDFTIAQRMSWAARRKTSRIEDTAYCLLGLFEVNMPLLYGEGAKAFLRLQEEVLRTSDDTTIFLWTDNRPSHPFGTGILAPSPSHFVGSDAPPLNPADVVAPGRPYRTTNQGLEWTVTLFEASKDLHDTLGVHIDGIRFCLLPLPPTDPLFVMLLRGYARPDWHIKDYEYFRRFTVLKLSSKLLPKDWRKAKKQKRTILIGLY